MAKCLVLGANGFIGSHLVDALVEKGHEVRAFGRFSNEPLFDSRKNVELFNGNFLNRNDLREALKNIEYVFHFISTTTPVSAESDPLIDIDTNIKMSVEMFEECVNNKVKRVIFASTGGAIYGANEKHPLRESDLAQPVSPYAIGKLTIENYLRYFKVKYGLNSISLRISNPYGERQPLNRRQGVIPIFMERLYRGEQLTVLGDGSMTRDYIYVRDVASIIAQMFTMPASQDLYNLGSGKEVSVNQLIETIETISGKKADTVNKPVPPTFVHKVMLDSSKFIEDFGVEPKTSLLDGMRHTWGYILKEHQENGQN